MKKLLLSIALVSFCFSANAQFGASVGYGSADNFDLLPSIAFGIGEKVEDESNNSLAIGLGLQYYPTGKDGNFFIQPGVGLGFSLADEVEGLSSSIFSGSIGLGIDLSDNFTLIASYGTSLSDPSDVEGISISSNSFGAALLYKF